MTPSPVGRAWPVFASLAVLAGAALVSMQLSLAELRRDREARLLATGEALAASIRDLSPWLLDPETVAEAASRLRRLVGSLGLRDAVVLDLDETVLLSAGGWVEPGGTEPAVLAAPETAALAWKGVPGLSAPFFLESVPFQAAFLPMRDEEGKVAALLVTVAGRETFEAIESVERSFRRVVGGSLSLLALLAVAAVHFHRRAERAARDLEHGQRLALAGQVAAGVAHEVRNPLGILRSTLEFVKDRARVADEDAGLLPDALEEVDRIEDIVGRFLALARDVPEEPRRIQVGDLVEAVARLVRKDLDARGLCLSVQGTGQEAWVLADPRAIRQALLNLVINSRDAMERTTPRQGSVTLDVTVDQAEVAIAVRDQGPGFPPEVLAEPFRAFRSGRPEGLGLGLALVHRLVTAAGGSIRLENLPGGGACATLRLPLARAGGPSA